MCSKIKVDDYMQIKIISFIITFICMGLMVIPIYEYAYFRHPEELLLIIPLMVYITFFSFIYFFVQTNKIRLVMTSVNLLIISSIALGMYLLYIFIGIMLDLINNQWLCPESLPCMYSSTVIGVYIGLLAMMVVPTFYIRATCKRIQSREVDAPEKKTEFITDFYHPI